MRFSRREFIQYGSATGLIALSAGGAPLLKSLSASTRSPATPSLENWQSSSCQGCTSWCSVQVQVVEGRAVKVRGNPHALGNHGAVCPRAHLALQQVYDPDRVKIPMKRTNPKKGRDQDPGFVPISWDEAMDLLASKMMELRAANEPQKFALLRGRYTGMADIIYSSLPKIFGSPNGISHSSICAEAEKFAAYYTEGFWDYRDYDLENTRFVLCWGADPLASNRQVPHVISLWGKVRDQAKIAVIDPRLSITATKSDYWLPVIPGEDGALAVAMAHVILVEGLWSREFVGDFKSGGNGFIAGQTVDPKTFVETETHGLVAWWNLELKDKTPQWAAERSGVSAELIQQVAREFALAAPAAISWVSPGTAMQVRGAYGSMAAHALNGLVGSTDQVGGVAQKTKVPTNETPAIEAYLDDLAKAHGHDKKIDQRGTLGFPALKDGKPGGGVITNRVADAILEEKPYDLKVVIAYWANFPFSCTGAQRWEQALAKLPFLAHVTTHASEMSHFADLVLPAAHQMFERWGFLKNKQNLYGYVTLNEPVMEPLWDVRIDESEVSWMLAETLATKGFDNLLRYYKESFKDPETGKEPQNRKEFTLSALKYYTQPLWDKAHAEFGKHGDVIDGWEQFVKVGVWNSKRYEFKTHWGKFKTATGKFEFYSETLKLALEKHAEKHQTNVDAVLVASNYLARGEAAFVPHYEMPLRAGSADEYPFVFFEHRSRLNREGRSANCTWYQAHKNADPGDENWADVLKVNSLDAQALGLANGDEVEVVSPSGKIRSTIKVWEGVRPGTVAKCYGQGHWAYGRIAALDFAAHQPRGGNNNELLPSDYERLSGSTARHGGVTRVKIVKL